MLGLFEENGSPNFSRITFQTTLRGRSLLTGAMEMAPKRATRSTPVTENPTTTTVTNAQLQAMIDQGVTAALAARDANRNGKNS
ncbi:hypothetical protein Tco_1081707 [Tanacetum coccineum]|uniref:Uncharacterized protein n=1 Tax=Tanacetum coccineum TaxID=301880 RepID=A0ABQ5HZY9_9ASTR